MFRKNIINELAFKILIFCIVFEAIAQANYLARPDKHNVTINQNKRMKLF